MTNVTLCSKECSCQVCQARKEKMRVVLAYSGGLDTSVAIKWLQEKYDADVITFTAEIGQNEDLKEVEEKAKELGAVKTYSVDLKKEFAEKYIVPAIKANGLYQGSYPLLSSLSRPLIVEKVIEIAKKEKAEGVAHGCTGKGNDQVRFEVGFGILAPDLKIIAPAREWNPDREELIGYAEKNGIPVPVTKEKPYSIDQNLWGISIEGGILEHPEIESPEDIYLWTKNPEDAPEKPEYIEIAFENGVPVKLNGKEMNIVKLIEKLNELGGNHGVGRIDHMENRVIGLKSREIYECPAATILIAAHKDLEKYTCTKHENQFKEIVDKKWAELVYEGLWYEDLKKSLDAFIDSSNKSVAGSVKMKLYKGSAIVAGRKSKNAIYDLKMATYGEEDIFNHEYAKGFIELFGLHSKMKAKILGGKRYRS